MGILFNFLLSLLTVHPTIEPEATAINAAAFSTPEFLVGKHNYYTDSAFVEIPAHMAYRPKMFLLDEVYANYLAMYEAAKKDGVNLKIISAARTFEEQTWLWEDKWKKNKVKYPTDTVLSAFIMQYSAMPGTSRHHWGTDVDLNSTSDSYFESTEGKKVYAWLVANANQYGFCQTYDTKGIARSSGYKEEKWHWSYFPLAESFLDNYASTVDYAHITGFLGDQTARELQVIANYVLAVSAECEK